ncbi:hypothetical protein HDV57DRAFT_443440 [Trichoderma longibrachiatum]
MSGAAITVGNAPRLKRALISATPSLALTRQSYLYRYNHAYIYQRGSKPLAPPTAKISIRRTDALLVRVEIADSVRTDFGAVVVVALLRLLLLVRIQASQELQPTNASSNCHELFIALPVPQLQVAGLGLGHSSIHSLNASKHRE